MTDRKPRIIPGITIHTDGEISFYPIQLERYIRQSALLDGRRFHHNPGWIKEFTVTENTAIENGWFGLLPFLINDYTSIN